MPRRFGFLVLTLLLLGTRVCGQFSTPGSPRYSIQRYNSNSNVGFDYVLMGLYRVQTPFFLPATNYLLDRNGDVVWYQQGQMWALDFKLHSNGRMAFNDNRYWHILDSNFAEVDSVVCRGYRNDPHDMRMTADGHYFLICIEDTFMDLRSILTADGNPGALNGRVDGVVIQQLDGAKNVVKEWHGLDHFSLTDADSTYFTNSGVYELNHTNSIDLDGNGRMLLSHRALNEISLIDWQTGNFIWHLGGKLNQFDLQGDPGLKGQHDARFLPGGGISTFDNGNSLRDARSLIYQLDTQQMRATISQQFSINGLESNAMGGFQAMNDGAGLVCFGRVSPANQPIISFFAADSTRYWDIFSLDSCATYRAHSANLPFDLRRPKLTCEEINGELILGVEGTHSQFEWTTGENSATIVVHGPGTYQAFVPRGIGMMGTIPLEISSLNNTCLGTFGDDHPAPQITPSDRLF
ncbi:MAG: hypothetical protein RLZZ519_2263 [Bacteroidota bacterium]|jgi:hypothetical protein